MAAIKSTLDIIMEKTRNLSLSDDERQAQEREEAEKKISGLVQRFKDNGIRLEPFRKELENLKDSYSVPLEEMLFDRITDLMTLDEAGKPLVKLFENIFGRDVEGLQEEFCGKISRVRENRAAKLQEALLQQYKISGSAVKVNPDADEALSAEIAKIKKSFDERLQQEKSALPGG